MRSERISSTCPSQGLILRGGGQKLLPGSLVKGNRVQFVSGHSPPARQGRTADQSGHQFMPDQGLNIFRDDKILLGFSQNKGQIRQRTRQVSASARRQAGTEYVRHPPGLSSSNRHFA